MGFFAGFLSRFERKTPIPEKFPEGSKFNLGLDLCAFVPGQGWFTVEAHGSFGQFPSKSEPVDVQWHYNPVTEQEFRVAVPIVKATKGIREWRRYDLPASFPEGTQFLDHNGICGSVTIPGRGWFIAIGSSIFQRFPLVRKWLLQSAAKIDESSFRQLAKKYGDQLKQDDVNKIYWQADGAWIAWRKQEEPVALPRSFPLRSRFIFDKREKRFYILIPLDAWYSIEGGRMVITRSPELFAVGHQLDCRVYGDEHEFRNAYGKA